MTDTRKVAVDALMRVEAGGAFANLVLPQVLADSGLSERDRHFTTELVYGTTRMRRACDWLLEPFLFREIEPSVRAALRLGAYQLHFLGTPPHAAVAATVDATPARARGLVNAVLRHVAAATPSYPDLATELSYPDWIVERLETDLGPDRAHAMLARMNQAPPVTTRPDGYVQDLASQWVSASVGAGPGELVADLCAGPGGKATAVAAAGARVVAIDQRFRRARLVRTAASTTQTSVEVVTGDGRFPPLRPGAFDRVLVDAPCSGLGALRRRPDARWRIEPDSVERLAAIQAELIVAASELVCAGGLLAYSVCTLTAAETVAVDEQIAASCPELEPEPPGDPWEPWGRGGMVLPQTADTDGMALFLYRVGTAMARY